MGKRIAALLAFLAAVLLLLPATAFAQSFTITIPERTDAIVSVTVDGARHEEGETFSVEAGTQVSAQAMQLSSTGAMFTGWSVSPEGAVELGNTKIVEFSMPEQNITLDPVIKSFEANASVDANGVLTWDEPFAGYVSRVEVSRQGRTVQSAWISAENGSYTLDVRQLLEERAGDDGIAEGSEHTIDLYYLANEAEFGPNGYRGSYLGATTYEYHAVEYPLSIGGIDVTSANAADVLGDGTVSYDPDTQTLTLKDAKITGTNDAGRSIEVDPGVTLPLTIALEGTNSCGPIMTQKGTVIISGSGSLTVAQPYSGTGQTGISTQDDLVIDGVKLTVNSNESGIMTNLGNITIKNGAQVEANAQGENAYCALSAGAGVTVTDPSTSVKASTDESYGNYPIISHSGDVTIKDGAYVESSGMAWSDGDFKVSGEGTRLVASTEAPNNGYAVNCLGYLTVEEGAVLKSTATVYSTSGVSVTGGSTLDVDAQSYENGFAIEIGGSPNTSGNIVVTDSTLIAKSQGDAVYGFWDEDKNSSFSATDSTVSLCSSAGYALLLGRDVTLSGGTITLEGAQGAIYVDNGNVDFGSDPTWYQWATSPAGAVKLSATDPYSYAGDTSTYLRFEPTGTAYELTVENGTGGGSYTPGTQVPVSTDSYDEDGHFTGWTVDDPTGAGILAGANDASTTFTMPAGNVTLTANSENHDFTHVDGKDPTCTDAGWEAYDECACGYSTPIKEISATDHSFTTYKPNNDATCTEDGTETATCDNGCGATDTRAAEGSATGHSFVDGICTVCGEEDPDFVKPDAGDKPGESDGSDSATPVEGSTGQGGSAALPATGDVAVFGLAGLALLGIAALGVGAFVGRRR